VTEPGERNLLPSDTDFGFNIRMDSNADFPHRVLANSSPVHLFEPFFWTNELSDNFRLKDRAIFHGSTSSRTRDVVFTFDVICLIYISIS